MTELVPMPEPWGSGPCSATEGKHRTHMVRGLHSWLQGRKESALAVLWKDMGPLLQMEGEEAHGW